MQTSASKLSGNRFSVDTSQCGLAKRCMRNDGACLGNVLALGTSGLDGNVEGLMELTDVLMLERQS